LDAEYKEVAKDSWLVVERTDTHEPPGPPHRVDEVNTITLGGPQTGELRFFSTVAPATTTTVDGKTTTSTGEPARIRVTLLTLDRSWRTAEDKNDLLRTTSVYTQSEELELAEEPIEELVCGGTDEPIELDDFYEGLEAGRWVVVSGERDIPGTSGVKFSELAMLATVSQDVQRQPVGTAPTAEPEPRPGERLHTFVTLAENLQYCFKRDTVTIYGNVVKATHGETRKEVLGSGDGAKALQSFALKQPPLTFVSAANPSGVESTLKVFVNDVRWHETDSLVGLSPTDRNFITKTDDEGKTTLVFGNGREAARLPSGLENIKAEYRNGLGKPGNVKAGQITLLVTRPLGVKEVINPLRASGGADKEDRNQARKSAPPSTKALDRLVSVQDYEDFSRTYAGIAKARAAELTDGRRQIVHVTIAGTDDIPIDETSDLFRNLRRALSDFGDPHQPIQLAVRELMLMVISANVRIHPDYQWDTTEPKIRAALLGAFGFERRELGQDSLLSEVISVMQAVRGVAYVDIDAFGGIPEKKMDAGERRLLTPEEISQEVQRLVTEAQVSRRPKPRLTVNLADPEEGTIRPAQLAFLTRDIPATLILNQIG
jgi:predicted phage baseplate assembly protein